MSDDKAKKKGTPKIDAMRKQREEAYARAQGEAKKEPAKKTGDPRKK